MYEDSAVCSNKNAVGLVIDCIKTWAIFTMIPDLAATDCASMTPLAIQRTATDDDAGGMTDVRVSISCGFQNPAVNVASLSSRSSSEARPSLFIHLQISRPHHITTNATTWHSTPGSAPAVTHAIFTSLYKPRLMSIKMMSTCHRIELFEHDTLQSGLLYCRKNYRQLLEKIACQGHGFFRFSLYWSHIWCLYTEADLGMFSMFGRTGAPQKWGPTWGPKKFLQRANTPKLPESHWSNK